MRGAAVAGDDRAGHEHQRFGLGAQHRAQPGFDQRLDGALGRGNGSIIAAAHFNDHIGRWCDNVDCHPFIEPAAVTVRRLHDIGRSGWWALLMAVPVVGALILVVFALQDSQPEANEYGPNPKALVVS